MPYDWRLKIEDAATQFIKPSIEKATRNHEEVDVVAHSMGGLVIRSYIQQYGGHGIRKVAFLGTPHRGSMDAYYLWESGKAVALTVWDRAGVEILLDNIKEGCGCGLRNDAKFIRFGCPSGSIGPIASVQQLMPVFPFLRKSRKGALYDIEAMCEQNAFLSELNATAKNQLVDSGIEFKVFAGGTERTALEIMPDRLPKQNCDRVKWSDRNPHYTVDILGGDNRVLFSESACPRAYIPAFEDIECATEDIIYPVGGKAESITHDELPDIFKEEIAAFLLACKAGERKHCYSGPPGTENLGVCRAGYQECRRGAFGECIQQILPSAEICDGIDTNCDGIPDLPECICTPGTSVSCYTGPGWTAGIGICRHGAKTCLASGTGYGACEGEIRPLPADICGNGLDDNCNYTIDDGCGGNPSFDFSHDPYADGAPCFSDNTRIVTHPHFVRDVSIEGSISTYSILQIAPIDGFRDPIEFRIDRVEKDNGPSTPAGVGPCSCYTVPCPGNGEGDATDGYDSAALITERYFTFKFDGRAVFDDPPVFYPDENGMYRGENYRQVDGVLFSLIRELAPSGRYVVYIRATSVLDSAKTAEEAIVIWVGYGGPIIGEQ